MTSSYKAQVDRLFSTIKAPRDTTVANPVTRDNFVWRIDPVRPQKQKAVRALEARAWFEAQRPLDAPDLPLGQRNCIDARDMALINGDWIAYLVARFGESVTRRDYCTENHPLFEEFARGLMASDMWPDEMHHDSALLRRYPPKPLPGVKHGVWCPVN